MRNGSDRFGAVSKFFHWVTGTLIIALLTIGLLMVGMDNSLDKLKLYGLHKSGGFTVLVLASLWLLWRICNIVPGYPPTVTRWQRMAANIAKYALFAFMFIMPLSGWGMSSAAGFPISVFGFFTLPDLASPDRMLSSDLRDVHKYVAYLMIAVVSVHGFAALLHHFYYKDNVLRRMLPFWREKNEENT